MSLLHSTLVRRPIIRFCSTTKLVWQRTVSCFYAQNWSSFSGLLPFCHWLPGDKETRPKATGGVIYNRIPSKVEECMVMFFLAWIPNIFGLIKCAFGIIALHSGDRRLCNGWMFCISISAWSLCNSCPVVVANSQSDLVFGQINFLLYLTLKKFAELNSKCPVSLEDLCPVYVCQKDDQFSIVCL